MFKNLSVAVVFLCVACSHTTSSSQKDFSNDKKAVVVARVSYNEGNKTKHYSLDENIWVQYENEKRTGVNYEFNNKIKSYAVEPGTYYLDTFRETVGNKYYRAGVKDMDIANWFSRQVGDKPSMKIKHVKFIVEPGEAVYIGDVVLNINSDTNVATWEIVDNYDEANKVFKEKHPQIGKELKKRLAEKSDPISVEQRDYQL